ncbi:hypothetical protein KOR42_51960 [Thalassoglobus neptunius]|uniref:Uncharacterized protein n=1 Tax=Thalassoglobus neptunius TaxID=1938619 RepID=A0A5C5V9X3_9PLAN|nr:cell division protein CrgA [Thalassoglobus neptunius]TWT35101.1 hypothetical protein KOR42_51960 [Thalassoglobus neptunius]
MRPCPHCGAALGNQIQVCPSCQSDLSPIRKQSTQTDLPETQDSPAHTVRDSDNSLWMEYLPLPLFAGLLFGVATFLAIGPWGIAIGFGVFLLAFLFRLVIDLA